MLKETLKNFPKQFEWEPKIENQEKLKSKDIAVVAGVGGSRLAAVILNSYNPLWNIITYADYGLELPEDVLKNSLVIASSYSGNTEETLDAFDTALRKNLDAAVIASGGKLLELAKESDIPFVQLPDIGAEPRFNLGFATKTLLKILNKKDALVEISALSKDLNSDSAESRGKDLSQKLDGKIPIIYCSNRNYALSYNWKIKLNETTKIPAFCNVIPESNHNEINGFDISEKTGSLTDKFCFVFLRDEEDHPRILKRMDVNRQMLEKNGFLTEVTPMEGSGRLLRIFDSLFVADWLSFYLAEFYGTEPEKTPTVAEFKKLLAL